MVWFLLGTVFGVILTCYGLGTILNKKFDSKEEFEEWIARIK